MLANRYKPKGQPQNGGMARVIRCKDVVLERDVAIKLIPIEADKKRLRDELNALFKIRSKHVVEIYDVFEKDSLDYAVVLEFIKGDDLFEPSTQPKSKELYLKMLWQIASGIADIHAQGLIHRDIKLNNMKLDGEGIVRIFDFGLARNNGNEACTLGFVGTQGFAAPELYNQFVSFTTAVDTYAFGISALLLATGNLGEIGKLPQSLRATPPVLKNNHFSGNLKFKLPDEVKDVLDKCLKQDPESRPAMKEVVDTLSNQLLKGKHRALLVYNNQPHYLDKTSPSVRLALKNHGELTIEYDDLSFRVKNPSGAVYINNIAATENYRLPGACVITLGRPEEQNKRRYITFDLSHPEIVL